MKVATLTLPLHTNYGGNLQAFALQKTLINLGHDAILLDFRKQPPKRNVYRRIGSKIKNFIIKKQKSPFTLKEQLLINKYHNEFIDNYINRTPVLYDEASLEKYVSEHNIDAVIVGSDQVWRPKYTPMITPFYLSFLQRNNTVKKISYAASFGVDSWEYSDDEVAVCRKLIVDFDSLSVRESDAIEMCKTHFSVHPEHVLDPTMLLSKDEYVSIFEKNNIPDKTGQIFSYVLDLNDEKNKFIKNISTVLKKDVFTTYPAKHNKTEDCISNIFDYQFPPIEAWLKSFNDADFIITDSFHGTVFSIIFNKPFIAICNKDRGSARFKSLLRMFSLEDRLIYDLSTVNADLLKTQINYLAVNKTLEEYRLKSLKYLSSSLRK